MNKKILILVALIAIIAGGKLEAQILYVPGGAGGIGNSTTNGNVGIGLNNPTANLVIKCNTNNASNNTMELGAPLIGPNLSHIHWGQTGDWYIRSASTLGNVILQDAGGKVGIGTTSPSSLLTVAGNIQAGTSSNGYAILSQGTSSNAGYLQIYKPDGSRIGYVGFGSIDLQYTAENPGSGHLFYTGSLPRMYINNIGNVGIGITNPKNLLDVNGIIHAREVKVDLTGWSDFVFHPSYQLKPLTEVEQFIKTNGHLHDIPSAAEVEQNGVNVGEMQKKLLQKVEELTLYVIELKKENEQLKAEKDQQLVHLQKTLETLMQEIEIHKIKNN